VTRTVSAGEGLVLTLGVIVANVPEGLLPTLTLALALGAQRMARRGSLVRRLSAVEGLGATTVICTDKTGTLTENRMVVRHVWARGRMFEADCQDAAVRDVLARSALASLATLERGDPMERALIAAAERAGANPAALSAQHPILQPYPFDSNRKRMTVVRAIADGPTAFVKGAPRTLLALCTHTADGGQPGPLDDLTRDAILAEHDRLARDGFRLLAVASRRVPDFAGRPRADDLERDLVFEGLIGLWDPPRPEVRDAIATCTRAGIRVVMITGDDGLTGSAIAAQVGLTTEVVVTGDELDRVAPEALARLAERRGVLFARASPAHKLAIVRALRERGEVVAVTGDGVNDAPALRAADVGVAMGKRGSEVAKEAAMIVISDDNFASIVAAIHQGRSIYANVGKFVSYIFASNVPELVPFLAAVFFHIPLPLTVMQILAVDLGTDLLPALALGTERPEPGIMDRPPRRRSERLLNRRRLAHAYGFLGVIEAALSLGAFFWVYWLAGWRPGMPMDGDDTLYARATTLTLAGIVAAQIGNVFACRTERESLFRVGLASNRFVLAAIVAEIAILVILVAVPLPAQIFGLAAPAWREWSILLAFPVIVLGLEEARKAWLRRVS
jgi:calcium-translocating P-type ATPase